MSTRPTDFCAPWCTDHASDPTPETGWCRGDAETIHGIETRLTGDPREGYGVVINQTGDHGELTISEARSLAERLSSLTAEIEPVDTSVRDTVFNLATILDHPVDPESLRTMADVRAVSAELGRETARRQMRRSA